LFFLFCINRNIKYIIENVDDNKRADIVLSKQRIGEQVVSILDRNIEIIKTKRDTIFNIDDVFMVFKNVDKRNKNPTGINNKNNG